MRIKKVSQTTPTQAQVVDGYSTSTTDCYSCNYVNTNFETKGVKLFTASGSGTSSGNINLDDTITDYDLIEVYGYTSDGICVFIKIPKTLYNKSAVLTSFATDGNLYVKLGYINIDTTNNRLSFNYNREWYKNANSSSGGYNASGNYVYITNVIGYKTGLFD